MRRPSKPLAIQGQQGTRKFVSPVFAAADVFQPEDVMRQFVANVNDLCYESVSSDTDNTQPRGYGGLVPVPVVCEAHFVLAGARYFQPSLESGGYTEDRDANNPTATCLRKHIQ